MSVVILGGNECMVRQYIDLCSTYRFKAKVYPKMSRGMRDLGNPDLLILFTGTMSHKMMQYAMNDMKGSNTTVSRSRSASISALKNILEQHCAGEEVACRKN